MPHFFATDQARVLSGTFCIYIKYLVLTNGFCYVSELSRVAKKLPDSYYRTFKETDYSPVNYRLV